MEQDHNKLLKQAARAVLKPAGLFQRGSSRTWADDNGWFFTVVEFQGSWCDRGSFLNVGLWYLWNEGVTLIPSDGVYRNERAPGWVGWKGDPEAFVNGVTDMAQTALKLVLDYRALADPQAAAVYAAKPEGRFVPYLSRKRFMTAALAGDVSLCRTIQREIEEGCPQWHPSVTGWILEELEQMAPLLDEPEKLRSYMLERIAGQRAYWRSKPGLRRLLVHPLYG